MKSCRLMDKRGCSRSCSHLIIGSNGLLTAVLLAGNTMPLICESDVDSSMSSMGLTDLVDDDSETTIYENGKDKLPTITRQSQMMTPTTFRDISSSAGIKIFRPTYGNPISGDFNNDGNIDFLVVNHGHSPSLFRNNANGTFTDIRAKSGITSSGDRHGAAWGDYDNDGDLDPFITIGADHWSAIGTKSD